MKLQCVQVYTQAEVNREVYRVQCYGRLTLDEGLQKLQKSLETTGNRWKITCKVRAVVVRKN